MRKWPFLLVATIFGFPLTSWACQEVGKIPTPQEKFETAILVFAGEFMGHTKLPTTNQVEGRFKVTQTYKRSAPLKVGATINVRTSLDACGIPAWLTEKVGTKWLVYVYTRLPANRDLLIIGSRVVELVSDNSTASRVEEVDENEIKFLERLLIPN
jgi:hypothetical protein